VYLTQYIALVQSVVMPLGWAKADSVSAPLMVTSTVILLGLLSWGALINLFRGVDLIFNTTKSALFGTNADLEIQASTRKFMCNCRSRPLVLDSDATSE
jgi:hypothetical protein